MAPRRPLSLVAALSLSLASCADGSRPPPAVEPAASPDAERSVVRTLRAELEVRDVDRAVARLQRVVLAERGHVERAELRGDEHRSAELTFRVPTDRFDAFRTTLHELGALPHETLTQTDVTGARADLAARLHSAGVAEARLERLLTERTATLSDVLAVQSALLALRERIERMDAEHTALAGSIAEAQIFLSVRPRAIRPWEEPVEAVARAGAIGVRSAQTVSIGGLCVIATVAPPLATLTACVAPFAWLARRSPRRKTMTA